MWGSDGPTNTNKKSPLVPLLALRRRPLHYKGPTHNNPSLPTFIVEKEGGDNVICSIA